MQDELITNEIKWYNNEILTIKEKIATWLKEFGYTVNCTQEEKTNIEELSGKYKTFQFVFNINNTMHITLEPYGIWIIGAKGRIDIKGSSGSEKLVYFCKGGPGLKTEIKTDSGTTVEKSSHRYFDNVDEDAWYWYDDSSYRKVVKLSKETLLALLERIQ